MLVTAPPTALDDNIFSGVRDLLLFFLSSQEGERRRRKRRRRRRRRGRGGKGEGEEDEEEREEEEKVVEEEEEEEERSGRERGGGRGGLDEGGKGEQEFTGLLSTCRPPLPLHQHFSDELHHQSPHTGISKSHDNHMTVKYHDITNNCCHDNSSPGEPVGSHADAHSTWTPHKKTTVVTTLNPSSSPPPPPPLSLLPPPLQELLSGNAADSCTPQNLGLLLIYHLQVSPGREGGGSSPGKEGGGAGEGGEVSFS